MGRWSSRPTNDNPYPLLHNLPRVTEGLDIYAEGRGPLCTPEMGGDYRGYAAGDLPISEEACSRLVFLPVLAEPIPGAAAGVLAAIRKVALHAEMLAKRYAA